MWMSRVKNNCSELIAGKKINKMHQTQKLGAIEKE